MAGDRSSGYKPARGNSSYQSNSYSRGGGQSGGYGGGSYGAQGNSYGGGSYGNQGNSYGGSSSFSGGALGSGLHRPEWETVQLMKFEKNFYKEHPDVTNRDPREIQDFLAKFEVSTNGANIPRPVFTFDEASFPSYVLKEVKSAGFDKPTSIQSQGWPMALSGRDMVGVAQTG